MESTDKALILYDGECGLCDRFVQFVLKRDKRDRFMFAPLQSGYAHEVLLRHGLEGCESESMVFVHRGRALRRGKAALTAISLLGKAWPIVGALRVLPSWLLDPFYNFVARRRYRWFGKLDNCRIPTSAERAKFLGI